MMTERPKNGEFYALGEKVFRAPIETKTETGTSINVGFPVCVVSEYVSADNVTECLNASRHHDALVKALTDIGVYGCGMLSQPPAMNSPEEAWLRMRLAAYERRALDALASIKETA